MFTRNNTTPEIIRLTATYELDIHEVQFDFKFNTNLSSQDLDILVDSFIDQIEKYNIFWGGGFGPLGITGCIDLSKSELSNTEGIQLLENFSNLHSDFIEALIMWE